MFNKIFSFLKKKNKRKMLATTYAIYKQYGLKKMFKGIYNKLRGYPLLLGIVDDKYAKIILSKKEYDLIGNDIFREQQSELSVDEQTEQIKTFSYYPKFSIIMPIYNAPPKWLEMAIASIQKQSYSNWELCAVDDGSKDLRAIAIIRKLQKSDERIKFKRIEKNAGISAASNVALSMSTGDYIVLVDQDDEITVDALFWIAKEINLCPQIDMLYSDECKILDTMEEKLTDFYFKPDWSPELLISHMYTGHLTVYRTELVRALKGFRTMYDFSQDYDLALRITEKTNNIKHIERVLYFWRMLPSSGSSGGKDFARISNISALKDAYTRRKLNAVVSIDEMANYGSITMCHNPLVSIIIPSDSTKTLVKCILGLTGMNTAYKNLEIIPVTNSKTADDIQEQFPYLNNLKICKYDEIYNFSDKCNSGAKIATGEYLVIYNDDVYPFSRDWVERLLEVLQYSGVGAVSPLMLYEDRSIQYAGMISNVPGQVGTTFNGHPFEVTEASPFNHFLMRNVSILSGACVMLRADLFKSINGFDAINTPNGHSDVDLSYKILERGLRCVYSPHAVMTHIGNHSWAVKQKKDKYNIYCLKRWGKYLGRDPYFTKSMRRAYYQDFKLKYDIFSPLNLANVNCENAKDILFVSHELSRTGAPILMMDAVKASLEQGDFPIVICPVDGPLREEYLKLGVTVIVDESVTKNRELFRDFAIDFDLVVVNTLVCTEAIYALSNSNTPVLWWVHDGTNVIEAVRTSMPIKLGKNIHVYCGSEYSQRLLQEFGKDYSSEILRYGVEDVYHSYSNAVLPDSPFVFLTIGSLEIRKAQDVLIKAIEKLPEIYRDKAEFIIVGNPLQKEMLQFVLKAASKYKCIKYLETMPREQLLKMYPQSICSIIPSRDEPTSMIGIESMMFSRTIVTSDQTGIGEFLNNGENGYVFRNENSDELAKIIKYIIDNPIDTLEKGEKARMIYEEHFTMDKFKCRYKQIVEQFVREDK